MITSFSQWIPPLAESAIFVLIIQWLLPSHSSRKDRAFVALRFLGAWFTKELLFALWWKYQITTAVHWVWSVRWVLLIPTYIILFADLFCIAFSLWFMNRRPRLFVTCGQAAVAYAVFTYTINFANAFFMGSSLPMIEARMLYAPLVALALCALFLLLAHLLKLKQHYLKHTSGTHIAFLVILGLIAVYIAFPSLTTLYNYELYLVSLSLFLFYLPALIFLLLLFTVLFWVAIRYTDQKRQLQETTAHIEDINSLLDDSKKSMHDFHKHIRHLQSLVAVHADDGTTALLKSEVDTYCKELLSHSEQDEMLLHLTDPTFRALLYGRRTQAKDSGIEFIVDASPLLPHFPLKNYQLVEIFENLLDNAFDSASAFSGKRWIRVILCCDTDDRLCKHTLCIQNPYEQLHIDQILSGRHVTTKGGKHQGIGLDKVNRLVRNTGGTLTIHHENHIFSVTVSYPDSL